MFFKKSIRKELNELAKMLDSTRLKKEDITAIKEFTYHGEEGLAVDQAITQLYEFDVQITQDIYNKIADIARRLKVKDKEYERLKQLIK